MSEGDRHAEDAVLVGRCLRGDDEAWEELLVRHRPLVMSIALRSGLGEDRAEEVYQSVCVTLLERLELLRDHRSLAAWVATTTARKCWRLRRRRAEPAPPAGAEDEAPRPEEELVAALEREAVRSHLEGMAEPCRTLLTLMFFEDASYETIARRLGVAVGSVGVYRRRCLDRLGAALEASGWLPAASGTAGEEEGPTR